MNQSLPKIGQPAGPEKPAQTPAVHPKRSVFPDHPVGASGR
ncbi:hypothetical protein ACFSQQ_11515 [Mesorhizobium kowhaii]